MSTDNRKNSAENATSAVAEGNAAGSANQNAPPVSGLENRTATEKETETGDDERDIKRKQARLVS